MDFNLIEQLVNGPGDQPSEVFVRTEVLKESILSLGVQVSRDHALPVTTEHGVSLAGPGLPIGKNSHIIAFGYFNDGGHELLEHIPLRSFLAEGIIELGLHYGECIAGYVHGFVLRGVKH